MSTQSTAIVKAEPITESMELAPQKPIAAIDNMMISFVGVSMAPFKNPEILMAEIEGNDVEIRPDGIIYLPEIKYRRRLNQAFGPGGWGLVPRGKIQMQDNTLMREYALFVDGRFVSQVIGEQDYIPNNPNMSYATAAEGCKSNALMRCCKDLGVASELWDPGFIEEWKREFAVKVWRKSSQKPQWRRKDREPFYDEKGSEKRSAPIDTKADLGNPYDAPEDLQGQETFPEQPPLPEAWQPAPAGAAPDNVISPAQGKRLYAIAKSRKMTDEQFKAFILAAGFSSSKLVTKDVIQLLFEQLEMWDSDSHTTVLGWLPKRISEIIAV